MFSNVLVPVNRGVQIEVAGWGNNALEKVGNPCDPSSVWNGRINLTLHGHIYDPKDMADFYGRLHVLLHYWPVEESFGYGTLQAMLSGAVPIGANAGGFKSLIRHGETGFLVESVDEAAYYASSMAFDEPRRAAMAAAGREWVLTEGPGNAEKAWVWWEELLAVTGVPHGVN
jgi:glycosyltransferase involved in cell wall biosynthesis